MQEFDVNSYQSTATTNPGDEEEDLDKKLQTLLSELDDFMNDDFNTAKVLANLFEIVPIINSLKDKAIPEKAITTTTLQLMKDKLKTYVEDILGLKSESAAEAEKLKGVMNVLIELRKDARQRKDWVTSDKIRNELAAIGIQLKDDKDGNISWTLSS